MASTITAEPDPLTAVGQSTPVNVEGTSAGEVWIHAVGPFVATAAVEVSIDGANWKASAASPWVAGDYKAVPEVAVFLRINVTAYTSGAVTMHIAGYTPQ